MAFEDLKENIDNVRDETKNYIEKTITYYKLWSFKVAMKSTTLVFKFMLIIICLVMVLLFGSVAAALAIGIVLENSALGFLIVGGVYLLLMFLLLLVKHRVAEGAILRKFSEIFFNDKD